jgi:hypothetical protein
MPGSSTTPGSHCTRDGVQWDVAFHPVDSVGTRDGNDIVAQWLACTYPCRRFDLTLADEAARLGANADRYSFIAVDLHHLLHAGLSGAPTARFRSSVPWSPRR